MSGLVPQLARSVAPVASTLRALSTSAAVLAAKGAKAKGATKPPPKKRQAQGFGGKGKGKAGGGSGRIQAGGVALRTTLTKEAADLTDLVQLYPESVIPLNVGKPSIFPRNTYDQLKTFGMPPRLEQELSSGSPASVIRKATLDIVKTLEGAKKASSKANRYVLGKSMLLLQAVSYAIESGWIVLYVPRASDWINSTSAFAYDAASQTFHQPAIAAGLLNKLMTVNRDRLASVTLPKAVTLEGETFGAGSKLDALVALGAKDERVAVPALEAVLGALGQQTQYPVLFAIDEVQTLFQRSLYRAPDYSPLESYHLSAPRLALDYLAGRKAFAHGALLSATSLNTPEYLPTPELIQGLGLVQRTPIHAYSKLDEHHLAHAASGLQRVDVPFGMSGEEAAAMFELWSRKGWVANSSDDVFLGGLLGGSGNPRELAREWQISHQSYIA